MDENTRKNLEIKKKIYIADYRSVYSRYVELGNKLDIINKIEMPMLITIAILNSYAFICHPVLLWISLPSITLLPITKKIEEKLTSKRNNCIKVLENIKASIVEIEGCERGYFYNPDVIKQRNSSKVVSFEHGRIINKQKSLSKRRKTKRK